MAHRRAFVDAVAVTAADALALHVSALHEVAQHAVRLAFRQARAVGEIAHRRVGRPRDLDQHRAVRRHERPGARRVCHEGESSYAARTALTLSTSCCGVKGFWMNGPSAAASV